MNKPIQQYYSSLNFNLIIDIKAVWKVVKINSSNEASPKKRDITTVRVNLHPTQRKLLRFFKNK